MSGPQFKAIDQALYEAGIVTEIIRALASADRQNSKEHCWTIADWLATQLQAQHDRIEEAAGHLRRD